MENTSYVCLRWERCHFAQPNVVKTNAETNMFVKYFKENYTEKYCKFPYRCFLVHLSLGVWEDPVADITTIDPYIFFSDQK